MTMRFSTLFSGFEVPEIRSLAQLHRALASFGARDRRKPTNAIANFNFTGRGIISTVNLSESRPSSSFKSVTCGGEGGC